MLVPADSGDFNHENAIGIATTGVVRNAKVKSMRNVLQNRQVYWQFSASSSSRSYLCKCDGCGGQIVDGAILRGELGVAAGRLFFDSCQVDS